MRKTAHDLQSGRQTSPGASRPAQRDYTHRFDSVLYLQRTVGNHVVAQFLEDQGDPASNVASWSFDPNGLLSDGAVNPVMASAATAALSEAVTDGYRPIVKEAFRSLGRSDELYALYKQGGPRAAPGWTSAHNYGLAIDVYIYDSDGHIIESPHKGWYATYKKFAATVRGHGFEWGEPINDTDHFEFHPAYKGLISGRELIRMRDWAFDVARSAESEGTQSPDWLQYLWFTLGAGGLPPASTINQP